jgi:hypothetical protein
MVNPEFNTFIESLHPMYEQLNSCASYSIEDRKHFPQVPAVYVLYENGIPIYTGRTKKLRQRMTQHIGNRQEQATLAFRLTREKTGNIRPTYKTKGSRNDLLSDPTFASEFDNSKKRVRKMTVKFVQIDHDILQHLFEVYCTLILKTPHNEFKTT